MTNPSCEHVDTLGRSKCDRCGLPIEMWPKPRCEHRVVGGWRLDGEPFMSLENYRICPFCPIPKTEKLKPSDWEIYLDPCYYDMWCVRNTNDKRFDSPTSFHFNTKEKAEQFKALIEEAK